MESFPAVESHHCRKGADKQTNKQTNKNKNTSNPVCSSVKCTKWMVKKKRTRGPSRCPAASTSHSLQTTTLLSIDQTKTSAYCVHSYVNDEETKSLSPDMKEKFREHHKRRNESRAEKDGDKKRAKADSSLRVATLDMQAVLQTPSSAVA